ncbi:MAG: DUF1992 domain-containing protein [Desulfobacterales bacterium]|nr:DUF1992 domain-containing protein [Desulfobacterales bacterium]
MKDDDQNNYRKIKYGNNFNRELTKAAYENSKNRKFREFVPQHENLVEVKIKQAMYDGKFDNLPGKGKPLDFTKMSNIPEHLRAGYQALKNAGFVPEEVILKKKMELLKIKINECTDNEEKNQLKKKFVDVSNKFYFYMDYNKNLK